MHAVIAYDIRCNKTRNRIFRALRELGVNSQRSVFECELCEEEIRLLLNRLSAVIAPETDSLLIYPLCRRCASGVHILGQGLALVQTDWEVL
ncbi:CRISPR-associated endonuclease Cas2 [Mailhella massiliensis]|uniref:CRISPR-associated endonuclease Cas2 n=1 Tax=Mailhella massiliensis TaxID=1903261 RepID=UPI002354E849|nr:CRISPR-associated endonuclease Cas2 [Mailhella massiliensis]